MTHISDQTLNSPRKPRNRRRSRSKTIYSYLKSFIVYVLPRRTPLYRHLPYGDSIRLLRIHPGNPGQDIRCSLELARLDKTLPSYEALSYVWGSMEDTKSITCNGHRVDGVRKNLFEALERLRYPQQSRLIWVDGLCIHQKDLGEMATQVRHMHHIYEGAKQVLVWLGTDEWDEAHWCFAILCAVTNARRSEGAELATFKTLDDEYGVMNIYSPPPIESDEWMNVAALFDNNWFVRMWVIQEIVLAKSATFIWGSAEIDWQIIGEAIQTIRLANNRYLNNNLSNRHWQNAVFMDHLCRLQQDKQRKEEEPFLHLLDWTRSFDVTNPRDKVYGLLGFPTRDADIENANIETRVFINPDYSLPVAQIYTDVVRIIIGRYQDIDVLSYVHPPPGVVYCPDGIDKNRLFHHVPEHLLPTWTTLPGDLLHLQWPSQYPPHEKLPSWVPDWNSGVVTHPFTGYVKSNQYTAGKCKSLELLPTPSPSILCLKGVIVDVISQTLPPTPFTNITDSESSLLRLVQWCINTGSPLHTVASTLTAGRGSNGHLVADTDQHIADFFALLTKLDEHWLENNQLGEALSCSKSSSKRGDPDKMQETIWKFNYYRSAFTTQLGKLGLGPGAMKAGDLVVVLWGGQVPFVLREENGGAWYQCVGESYVDGFMKGEVAGKLEGAEAYVERVFELR
ncbi:HET-domain-containing protein [Lindgomyces ingoldianus]|uniref:HET-domain-containing protein n=1 Tax=Lindgomyces ingoldianus TaxID=673940 RepID=A0ACB6QLQ4_9PLEO|nr:HET-domain-containing protein [Lindgomyces ingoldianus]KAF2467062.1 HET-domain-containing protein [Lindgomyces ingoldianus]